MSGGGFYTERVGLVSFGAGLGGCWLSRGGGQALPLSPPVAPRCPLPAAAPGHGAGGRAGRGGGAGAGAAQDEPRRSRGAGGCGGRCGGTPGVSGLG